MTDFLEMAMADIDEVFFKSLSKSTPSTEKSSMLCRMR